MGTEPVDVLRLVERRPQSDRRSQQHVLPGVRTGSRLSGLIDNIARQNIQDVNFRATVKPTKKTQLQAAMHFFYLSNQNDSLYQITGAPLGTPTGNNDVGNELDLLAQYNFNQNFSVEAGYFWFWYGTTWT